MNILDIILLVAIGVGFIYGYCKGLIKQLTFGISIALGIILAILHYPVAAEYIKGLTGWIDWLCIPAGFVAIFICVIITLKVTGVVLSGILKLVHLAFIDRTLGAVFSTIIAIFICTGLINIVTTIAPDNKYTNETTQKESLLYKHMNIFTSLIIDEAEKKI